MKTWCFPKEASGEYVCRMEDVLNQYARPLDPHEPLVCMDEASRQLIGQVTAPEPLRHGQPRREDYEYVRNGTCNLFMFCQPLAGWRHVQVTERRTKRDWAHAIRNLVDVQFPEARRIISTPTRERHCTKPSLPRKPGVCWTNWNSTTPQSTPAG